ncbi:Sjogren's syndrome/scleroderma autoantigen 1 family protein [Thermococcus sp.]|uniref:Sjogren's syndrome/scleroderma autoantigen 1 family protein n=1 Tax=Thermococcus sp. TaxID=35749 RepID=UPI00262E0BBA|nr:Sjogren's syndrome/scleroderma autoantigen 1 family protein [Thermococcus sp.]
MTLGGPTEEEIRNVIMPLMLSGAKMLDRHCPKCGSPLFEKDGRVFCPVCEYRAKKRKKEMRGVEERLMEKLNELANSLPDDPGELEKHLRVMGKIMELLERYKKLEGGE